MTNSTSVWIKIVAIRQYPWLKCIHKHYKYDTHTRYSNKGRASDREREGERESTRTKAKIAHVIWQSDLFLFTFLITDMGIKQHTDCDENGKHSTHTHNEFTWEQGQMDHERQQMVNENNNRFSIFILFYFPFLHLVLIIFNHFWSLLKMHSMHIVKHNSGSKTTKQAKCTIAFAISAVGGGRKEVI